MKYTTVMLFCACLAVSLDQAVGGERYEFRNTTAYKQLSEVDRGRLEQVHRDFLMLWGALDRYSDEHDGKPPETLSALVPHYLAELPTDPFATKETAGEVKDGAYTPSKNGWGYQYRKGPMLVVQGRDNRAWVLRSIGLPDFPYLADKGNVGLYVCKGIWL